MRPAGCFFLLLLALLCVDGLLFSVWLGRSSERAAVVKQQRAVVAVLGFTDLCVATEARYTRHPAVSDPIAPFMYHPGVIEHFPTGSFWRPVGGMLSER